MPTRRYRPSKRYKLSSSTPEQVTAVLKQHNYRVPAAAKVFGVTPQALNQWLRRNNCQRIIQCEDQPEARAGK